MCIPFIPLLPSDVAPHACAYHSFHCIPLLHSDVATILPYQTTIHSNDTPFPFYPTADKVTLPHTFIPSYMAMLLLYHPCIYPTICIQYIPVAHLYLSLHSFHSPYILVAHLHSFSYDHPIPTLYFLDIPQISFTFMYSILKDTIIKMYGDSLCKFHYLKSNQSL